MKKAELRKMPKISLTSNIKHLVTIKSKGKDYYGRPYKGMYRYYLRSIEENRILKVSVFDAEWIKKGITTSIYDIFIDTDNDVYLSLEYDQKGKELRWRKSMISNLLEYYWQSGYENFVYSNRDMDRRIKKLLGQSGPNSYRMIDKYQSEILAKRIEKKEAAECAVWDKDMKPIKELTPAFKTWVRKNAIKEHFIFYKYSTNIKTGYCSHCDREVDISGKKVKNNINGTCPACKALIRYKSTGKIKTLHTKDYYVQMVQPYPGGYVLRALRADMYYRYSDYKNPVIRIHEYHRYLYGETNKFYSWERYKNKYLRWQKKAAHEYYDTTGTIYPKNLHLLPFQEMFRKAFKNQDQISLSKWAYKVKKDSIYERLINAGFTRLFSQMFEDSYYFYEEIHEEGTALHQNLKLDKMRMKRLKKMNGGRHELKWFQLEKEENTIWPDEMIRIFSEGGYTNYDFKFIYPRMTYPQIWEYLKKQYKLYGYTWDYSLSCWRDYMNMAEKLNIPLDLERNYKPKDVRIAHNEVRDMLQGKDIEREAKALDKKWKSLKKVYPKLTKYEYADKDYQIIAPKSTKDIVREGMILKHCVHTCDYYFQRMTSDETYILFLRKASSPNIPYYTLEVEPGGNIRQKRTTGDRQNKDFEEAHKFLKKWQRAIQKRLTREDKALGKKSNAMRIKELAELREKGNRVWHGVLQGQLLADVLEADFMPVMIEKEELPVKAV